MNTSSQYQTVGVQRTGSAAACCPRGTRRGGRDPCPEERGSGTGCRSCNNAHRKASEHPNASTHDAARAYTKRRAMGCRTQCKDENAAIQHAIANQQLSRSNNSPVRRRVRHKLARVRQVRNARVVPGDAHGRDVGRLAHLGKSARQREGKQTRA